MDITQHLHKTQVRIDQRLRVGTKIIVIPTDIDASGVRLNLRGEKVGGPDDGATVHESAELAVGSKIDFGDQIVVYLLGVAADVAQFGVTCPNQFVVYVE